MFLIFSVVGDSEDFNVTMLFINGCEGMLSILSKYTDFLFYLELNSLTLHDFQIFWDG